MKPYSQHQIEELLNKFMEGNTTIEEESLLSEYFSTTPHIPDEWADYKVMFGYLDRGLEGDLLPESASPTHRKWLWWTSISAAAAVVALVFGLKVLNNIEATQPVSRPIAAQNDAKKAATTLWQRMMKPTSALQQPTMLKPWRSNRNDGLNPSLTISRKPI